MVRIIRAAQAALIVATLAAPAAAQQQYSAVTQADIQKLQDTVFLADRDISNLRDRDSSRATQLSTELSDLKDEVIYLKVKLRKERSLNRNEFADVRNRIDDLRTRAQSNQYSNSNNNTARGVAGNGDGTRATQGTRATARGTTEIPVGTEMDLRLSTVLNSGTAVVEDRFEGTTMADLIIDGRTLVPAGSVVRGVVASVQPAGRVERKAKMDLSFDQITINGRAYPFRATLTQAVEGEGIRGDATKAGAGAAVGAIIGGILGGVKGALAGVLIGGGGVVAATEGKEIELPAGSVLRVRVDTPVAVNAR
jgi:TolA-binding protein